MLLQQEMMGWQWHQLNHMQIMCTSLQTDNHASTSPLSFYRLDALPTDSVKALKAVPEENLCDKWHGLSWSACPSHQPTDSVKTLKELKTL